MQNSDDTLLDLDNFYHLVKQANLNISDEEISKLYKAYLPLQKQVSLLHQMDLGDLSTSTAFLPNKTKNDTQ